MQEPVRLGKFNSICLYDKEGKTEHQPKGSSVHLVLSYKSTVSTRHTWHSSFSSRDKITIPLAILFFWTNCVKMVTAA
jgi:hypothetical protein